MMYPPHGWLRQWFDTPGIRAEIQFSISPLRFGVEVHSHAGSITFAQIEQTEDNVDAWTGFASFDALVLNLVLD